MTVIGNKLYMCGGELLPRVPIDDALHCYDFENQSWEQVRGMGVSPGGRIAPTMCTVGSRFYLFGGRVGVDMSEGAKSDLFSFDTEKNLWINVAPNGTPPSVRSFHAMTSAGKKVYVFGGCGEQGRMNDLHSFDIETDTWEQLPSCDDIKPRGGSNIAVIDNTLYVVFGFAGEEQNDIHELDLTTLTWSKVNLANPIPPRSVFGLVSRHGKLFIFGGELVPAETGHAGAGKFSNELWCFDPKTNELKKLAMTGSIPTPRGWFPAAATENGFVLFGGLNSDNVRLSDLWSIEFPS